MKQLKILLIIVGMIVTGTLFGCGASDEVGKGSSNDTEVEMSNTDDEEGVEQASVGEYSIAYQNNDLDLKEESGPITLLMNKLQVNQLKVADDQKDVFQNKDEATVFIFDLKVENTGDETVLFFPNEATLTTDTGEVVEADKLLSDLVGDPVQTDKAKEGDIVLLVDTPAAEISEVTVYFEGAKNKAGEQIGEAIEMVVPLKE